MTAIAGEAAPAASTAGAALSVDLEFQEVGYSIVNWGLEFEPGPVTFTKEPDFGAARVTRHGLKVGPDAKTAVSLAWDRGARKIHLDLNRNGDLTDDTNGVFTSSSSGYYQTFEKVRLPLELEPGGAMVRVDLNLASQRPEVGGYIALKSYWQGRLEVGQRAWQVGLVPELRGSVRPGYLLLRPWENRQESFTLYDGRGDAFTWPQRIFWRQQGYNVAARFQSAESPRLWRVELTPCEAPLGELKLTGQGLSRVLLGGGEWTVVLDQPSGTVRVPEGTYARCSVSLRQGEVTAHREAQDPPGGSTLKVSAAQPTVLTAGGPLTNRVSVTRRGRVLNLSYQLVGAEGATYELGGGDRSHPPQFAVYQGDKEIASGKFEYG